MSNARSESTYPFPAHALTGGDIILHPADHREVEVFDAGPGRSRGRTLVRFYDSIGIVQSIDLDDDHRIFVVR